MIFLVWQAIIMRPPAGRRRRIRRITSAKLNTCAQPGFSLIRCQNRQKVQSGDEWRESNATANTVEEGRATVGWNETTRAQCRWTRRRETFRLINSEENELQHNKKRLFCDNGTLMSIITPLDGERNKDKGWRNCSSPASIEQPQLLWIIITRGKENTVCRVGVQREVTFFFFSYSDWQKINKSQFLNHNISATVQGQVWKDLTKRPEAAITWYES